MFVVLLNVLECVPHAFLVKIFSFSLGFVVIEFINHCISVFTEFQVVKNLRSYMLEVSVYKTFLHCGVGLVKLLKDRMMPACALLQ